ncbi:DUF7882 family protein [Subtercola sp. YIM 133946]|uniref:DUF7882 family protein n=1 Tax=Subtercola sp. YIM 133946 TaxID=3118909 RepID=UPI002F949D70
MGTLTYDGTEIELDDRTLTHLQIVIIQKLRRCEAFAMSWPIPTDLGSGRASIWLHPSIPIHFRFHGSRVPAINPAWLATLTESANSSYGLIVTPENPSLIGAAQIRPAKGQHERHLEPA